MDVTGEIALLFVVALPIATIVALNLLLLATGERDTLMLPLGAMKLPAMQVAPRVELGYPRSELVDTGAHPALAVDENWAMREAA